ncbi:hypothetical protein D8B34_24735 [Verminephrobacter eiseniae]|nr:hypothetical protein [Verminephrobacter eiseniae]MCW5293087.1 hypothetical protein [Verminephrobacter eiseniae]MCW8187560.1 hypothetical protein [Verminephrobacter eiseniae]MCW8225878.1 hypothetical protein [Verminephrobacter eiseniae]MCW8236791.1 hypothetical protein [Verminephrobacter eiseniae]
MQLRKLDRFCDEVGAQLFRQFFSGACGRALSLKLRDAFFLVAGAQLVLLRKFRGRLAGRQTLPIDVAQQPVLTRRVPRWGFLQGFLACGHAGAVLESLHVQLHLGLRQAVYMHANRFTSPKRACNRRRVHTCTETEITPR